MLFLPSKISTWICLLVFVVCPIASASRWRPRSSWIPKSCEAEQCYPSTGDLLVGRERQLTSTSTCGMNGPERFCTVSLEPMHRSPHCMLCDSTKPYHSSRNPRSHRIGNIVTPNKKDPNRWWQSENGVEKVAIELDLEAEFHFTHLMMRFKTFRPQAMLIERSSDFGRNWKIYRYFADNCTAIWPGIRVGHPTSFDEVVCDERYSGETPSSNGEIVFRALPTTTLSNPWAEDIQNLLKITNLRINFTMLRTLGDDLLDNRRQVKEKYYYAMYNMVIRGSCSCYGHAANCVPLETLSHDTPNMVYGRCNCTHNTQGNNCEQCADFYWDAPWRPAIGSNPNECKKCNCNGHASRCHFDASIYAASGTTSGGVCDDCGDNTEGIHCERCRPHFYLVDGRRMYEKDACQPCDCDPAGQSQECDWQTNLALGYKAGRCYCRTHVEGGRCDTCKPGFFNLTNANIDGCQACDCHWPGVLRVAEIEDDTMEDYDTNDDYEDLLPPCDPVTGVCTCKRNVMGERCQECVSYHYWKKAEEIELLDDTEGCLPCDCDLGGAFGSQCDLMSGQCGCRKHITSRTCNRTEASFWLPSLDTLRLEAEEAVVVQGRTQTVDIGPPSNPGVRAQHTGTGHVLMWEDTTVHFTNVRVPFPTHYDVVLRYKLEGEWPWRRIQVILNRSDALSTDDGSGICANVNPEEDTIDTAYNGVELIPTLGAFQGIRVGTFCFEPERIYSLTLKIPKDSQPDEKSFLQLDSIVLMPAQSQIPLFQVSTAEVNYLRDEFSRERCAEILYNVNDPENDLSPVCQKLIFSVVASMFPALPCDCDETGSLSANCFYLGGQCPCRDNYMGRRCERCAPHTFRLPGTVDCTDCACSDLGSFNRSCANSTGQCPCHDLVEGLTCNHCQMGYFGFPHCQECACNGFSEQCSEPDGACINCREHTTGPHCTACNDTFYGDPLRYREMGWDTPCRKCNCPGIPPHGPQHADSCSLITSSELSTNGNMMPQDFFCHCHVGYAGQYCDQCAPNFFGNPASTQAEDTCRACDCNDHINPSDNGNCDSLSGQCLQCLHSTVGDHCEKCSPYFFGDAVSSEVAPADRCKPCFCFVLGVNVTTDCPDGKDWRDGFGQCMCQSLTGHCNCLGNVTGERCDACLPAHYGLATGKGCLPCNCDPIGAESDTCTDEGICTCKQGFGGRRCNECPDEKWGDAHGGVCELCDCDPVGTEYGTICDKVSGQCVCRPGITGRRCDRCARGTTGETPSECEPCGECFDNWDASLTLLKGNASELYAEAERVRRTGVSTAFAAEFSGAEEALTNAENAYAAWPALKDDYAALVKSMSSLASELYDEGICPYDDGMDDELVAGTDMPELKAVEKLCSVSKMELEFLQELDVWGRTASEIAARIENMKMEVKNYNDNATNIFDAADAGANRTISEEAAAAKEDAAAIAKYAENRENNVNDERDRLESWYEQSKDRLVSNAKQLSKGIDSLARDVAAFEEDLNSASNELCLAKTQQCSVYLENAQTVLFEGRTLINQRILEADGRLTVLNTKVIRLSEISSSANSYLAMAQQVCDKLNVSSTNISAILNEAEALLKCSKSPDDDEAGQCGVNPEDLRMIEQKLDELSLVIEDGNLDKLLSNLTEAAKAISSDTDMARLLAETEPQLEASEKIKQAAEDLEGKAKSVANSFMDLLGQMKTTKMAQMEMSEKLDESLVTTANTRATIEPLRTGSLSEIESKNLAAKRAVDGAKREATLLHGEFTTAKDTITRIDGQLANANRRRDVARRNLTEIENRLSDLAKRFQLSEQGGGGPTFNASGGVAGKLAERAASLADKMALIGGRQAQVLKDLEALKKRGTRQSSELQDLTARFRRVLKHLSLLHSHHATCTGGQSRSIARQRLAAFFDTSQQPRPLFEPSKKRRKRHMKDSRHRNYSHFYNRFYEMPSYHRKQKFLVF